MKKRIITGIFSAIRGAAANSAVVGMKLKKQVTKKQIFADKHLALYLLMNQWVKVKAIVFTPITYFNDIETLLSDKVDCPIVSLEDSLYQV